VVGNLSQTTQLNVSIRVVDFTYYDETGTPKIFLSPTAPQTTWSLKPFLTIEKSITVAAGQEVIVPYTLTIPAGQGAGSFYSAIDYSATAGTGGGNVGLNASGVTLMFATVSGIAHENVSLQKFGAYQPSGTSKPGSYLTLAFNKPQQLGYTLKNSGNVVESPSGSASLSYMFGGDSITIPNININQELALIGQTRLFTTCINTVKKTSVVGNTTAVSNVCASPNLKPGRYTATLSAFYGQNGNPTREIVATSSFWYLPWWFVITFLAILAIVILLIIWIVRKILHKGSK
jgi:hypothetical protein